MIWRVLSLLLPLVWVVGCLAAIPETYWNAGYVATVGWGPHVGPIGVPAMVLHMMLDKKFCTGSFV